MITQPVATIFAALVVVAGGAISYIIQKAKDRSNEIHKERRDLYRRYVLAHQDALEAIVGADMKQSFEAFNSLQRVIAELQVTAPDPVVVAAQSAIQDIGRIGQHFAGGGNESDESGAELFNAMFAHHANLVYAMRQDSFPRTIAPRLDVSAVADRIQTLLPF